LTSGREDPVLKSVYEKLRNGRHQKIERVEQAFRPAVKLPRKSGFSRGGNVRSRITPSGYLSG
jgi:hypothetical protein